MRGRTRRFDEAEPRHHSIGTHPPTPPDLANQPRLFGPPHVASGPRRGLRADVLAEVGQVQRVIRLANQLADVTPELTPGQE
jgi:hypothetical protein